MKRVIVDYKKLTKAILDLLVEKYPDGYNDSDIVQFRNASNEIIEAVEVRTDDTVYLVKVSVRLEERMESVMDDDDDETSTSEDESIEEVDPDDIVLDED